MKLERVTRDPQAVPFPLVFGALAILCTVAAAILVRIPGAWLLTPLRCPFLALTGLPCPTCGGTRAFAALAGGNLWRALLLNPLVTVTVVGILAAAAGSLWRRLTRRFALRFSLNRREEFALRGALATAAALHWTFLILRR
ncbi:MAG: DUF2752 domain-containing protein [Acidobacteria bacterium]|nr:DUF2752 domain-containing protein [Acidobacteriota bacterium]